MDRREYIINVFERRFVPTPSKEEIAMVTRHIDTLSDAEINKLHHAFLIIDGEIIDDRRGPY